MKRVLFAFSLTIAAALPARGDVTGWDYLIDKLARDGVDRRRVVAAFSDERVGAFTGLEFSPDRPREHHSMYRGFLTAGRIADARRCRLLHADAFEAAEERYGVSANALAAVLYVETGCGRNTGSSLVLYRLARLAMANEPENLQRNFDRFTDADGRLDPGTEAKLRTRGRYLEDTFYPEVRALFLISKQTGIDPLEVRGSGSGAFGYPQFLPTSYLSYGVDADGDGRVSLYDTEDAAASCARYLSAYGWKPGADEVQRRGAVWAYNHSDAYVDTVLGLARRISQPPPPAVKRKVAKAGGKAAKVKGKAAKKKPAKSAPQKATPKK